MTTMMMMMTMMICGMTDTRWYKKATVNRLQIIIISSSAVSLDTVSWATFGLILGAAGREFQRPTGKSILQNPIVHAFAKQLLQIYATQQGLSDI